MGKRSKREPQTDREKAQREADGACRRLGLPTSESPGSVVGAIRGALDQDVLDRYDTYEGNDRARLDFMFADPRRALWLSAGLRMPLVRVQLGWLLWALRRAGVGQGSYVVDIGSGAGLTASVLAKGLGAQLVAMDPQQGSGAATAWVADQLGVVVDALEVSSSDWPAGARQAPDVLIAQAVLWYLEPDLSRADEPMVALAANPPQASPQMATFLDRCAASRVAAILDHDFKDLWVLVITGLAERGMFPDWASAELVSKELPGRDDRQLSLTFTSTRRSTGNLAKLDALLSAGEG